MLMRGRPTEPEVWPNGLPGPDIENGQNPYVITTNATGYQDNPSDFLQANGGVDISNPWIKNLKLTISGAIDKHSETNKIWQTPWMLYTKDGVKTNPDGTPVLKGAIRSNFTDPRLTEATLSKLNTNLTALLTYGFKVGADHSFDFLAGVTKEEFEGNNYFAFRRNYISAAVDQLFAEVLYLRIQEVALMKEHAWGIMGGLNITLKKNIWRSLYGDTMDPISSLLQDDLDFSRGCYWDGIYPRNHSSKYLSLII
jgi:hypothetical protein